MKSDKFSLEIEALRASGIADKEFARYSRLLDELQSRILRCIHLSEASVTKAKQIFDYLWHEKPERYRSNGCYKLLTRQLKIPISYEMCYIISHGNYRYKKTET